MSTTIHPCRHNWNAVQRNTRTGDQESIEIYPDKNGFGISGERMIISSLKEANEYEDMEASEILFVVEAHNARVVVSGTPDGTNPELDDDEPEKIIMDKPAGESRIIYIRAEDADGYELTIEDF